MSENIRIGITHGDINGISYEIIMKALSDNRLLEGKTITVYGSTNVASFYKKACGIQNFTYNQIQNVEQAHRKKANIINVIDDVKVEPGKSTIDAGKSAIVSLDAAVQDLKDGKIDVIVTAPINKQNVKEAGFDFPGHTEYFAKHFESKDHVMLLMNDLLKIGLVAGHIPLKEVPAYVTKERILAKLEVLHNTMKIDYGIVKPKIAVLGLNPHAGDNGVIGDEEETVIKPALAEAREKGIMALGPFPADGFFGASDFSKFDVVLGMYHDQSLAPFKALDFESAVNFTAGLPIVRVSPGHGTAYDLAGKNEASEASFIQAIYTACDVFKMRTENQKLIKNQLK